MKRYVIEWQAGGEMVLDVPHEGTASEWDEDALSESILGLIQSKVDYLGEDIADDVDCDLISSSPVAELKIRRI